MYEINWRKSYEQYCAKDLQTTKRPIIGITGNYHDSLCELGEGYYQSILVCGGIPMIIPPLSSVEEMASCLDSLDGLILSGGADVNPILVGEEPSPALKHINSERDHFELLLTTLAYDRQIPILGICRGIQLLTLALGGSIFQDIYEQSAKDEGKQCIKHSQDLEKSYPSHSVSLHKDSMLSSIFQAEKLYVNSFHHQAVKDCGKHLKVSAMSPDGIIEGVESNEYKSIIGVQWHPECFMLRKDQTMLPIFSWLVGEAQSFASARALHTRIVSLDSHCDTPMFFGQGIHFEQRDNRILVDAHKIQEGKLDVVVMAAYLPQRARTEEGFMHATNTADSIFDQIDKIPQKAQNFALGKNREDAINNKRKGKKTIFKAIENGYALGKDITRVRHFKERGVIYITLCHNGDNDICDSARGSQEHNGISAWGEKVIHEMNEQGIMVDLSHASEKSFYDALEISATPIICSHSSSKVLCDHPRNLTDDQLRAIAKNGGVAQVTFYSGFLKAGGKATILDAVAHLNHMVNVAGVDNVGIGTDFDGDGGVLGCNSAAELINFTRQLLLQRYNDDDIRKIWGSNFLRVMSDVQHFKA